MWMSSNEVAKMLGVTAQCLGQWRRAGVGPSYTLIGGRYRYAQADVDAWLRSKKVEHES